MEFENFEYFDGKIKKKVQVKVCNSPWSKFSGLMFKKNSPNLLFVFKKQRKISIHSFFCKSFKAIFLDEKKRVVKKVIVNKWKFDISCYGKYLLEMPLKHI